MRVLQGGKSFLNISKCSVRWCSKGKSYIPPKELSEMAKKSMAARKLIFSTRLEPKSKKPSETPTLEIICRALASVNSAGKSGSSGDVGKSKEPIKSENKDQIPIGFNSETKEKKPNCTRVVPREHFSPQPKVQSEPLEIKSQIPIIFNCKTCSETPVKTQAAFGLMIVNCKTCSGDGGNQFGESILGSAIPSQKVNNTKQIDSVVRKLSKTPPKPSSSKDPSSKNDVKASAQPEKSPESTPLEERFSMPQKNAFPIGRNPCVDGKKKGKPAGDLKQSTGRCANQGKPIIEGNIPDANVKLNAPETKKSPVVATVEAKPKVEQPIKNIPPTEKNGGSPCKEGKRDVDKPKCSSPKPEKKEPLVEQCKEEKKKEKCPSEKQNEKPKCKGVATVPSDSPKVKSKPPESILTKPKLPEEKLRKQGIANPEQPKDKPVNPPIKATAPPKPSPKSEPQSPEEKPPPISTSRFSMPLLMAFPQGRNPCRDGPRKAAKAEPKEAEGDSCESEPDPCALAKKKPDGCSMKTSLASEASKTAEKVIDSTPATKDSSKDKDSPAVKGSLPTKEIKVSVDPSADKKIEKSKDLPACKEIEVSVDPSATKWCLKVPGDPSPDKKIEISKELPAAKDIKVSVNPSADKKIEISKELPAAKIKVSVDPSADKKIKVSADLPTVEVQAAAQKAQPNSQSKKVKRSDKSCEIKQDCIYKPKQSKYKCDESSETEKVDDSETEPELKKFPALPLKQSLASYVSSIEPLLTKEELKEEMEITKKFLENEGKDLQELLEKEAESSSNWLTPRWTQAAYLTYQAPLTVFSSPGISFPIQEFKEPIDYVNFAAKAIYATFEFKQLIDQNKIPVVKMGSDHLDNSQFCKIFGTVRKPGRFCDTLEQHDGSKYVVVVHKNNYFKLPVCSEGCPLHVNSLRDALQEIIDCPQKKGEPIGLLTHDNRSNWAEARGVLSCPHGNVDSIQAIEQSLFVVCLDQCLPIAKGKERVLQAHQLLHGGGLRENSANRWMDKTIQLIVNPNGLAGFCYEHSPADCQPLAMLMDFVHQKVTEENYGCDSGNSEKEITTTLLKFQPINDCINLWLCQAMRNIYKISTQVQLNVFDFDCHGKCFIKAQGLNPDSYIQMAISLAYYSMYKKIPAQYEPAHLRIFTEGRTEAIRSTSNESKAFILAMESESASDKVKLAALHSAVDAHEKLTKEALIGQGIDRHLFGLQQMAKENCIPLPEFFQSKGFIKSVTFQLFTSQVATSNEGFMSHGPLLSDGYGICYNPQEKKIIFSISAWQTCPTISPVKFSKAIKRSLNAMRKLILKTGGDRVGEDPCKCEKVLT